eukprot:12901503-Prorocentrum_lima.AAC.1
MSVMSSSLVCAGAWFSAFDGAFASDHVSPFIADFVTSSIMSPADGGVVCDIVTSSACLSSSASSAFL